MVKERMQDGQMSGEETKNALDCNTSALCKEERRWVEIVMGVSTFFFFLKYPSMTIGNTQLSGKSRVKEIGSRSAESHISIIV